MFMATKDVNSTGNMGQDSQNDDLYPDMIIEEEFVDVYITDDTDTDDSDYPAGTSAQPGAQTSGNKAEKASVTKIDDTSAPQSSTTGIDDNMAGSDSRADSDKKDKAHDKEKKAPDAGDGLSIEDIDDQVVAQTNKLIEEKKAARKGGCGCGC